MVALPGGWIADRLLGLRRAVFWGGVVIAAGHFTLAVPRLTFYVGLVLIVIGTGLLKPNISAMVGDLYPEGGARRDAGFSIYYMGINIGGFFGPLICGYLGETSTGTWDSAPPVSAWCSASFSTRWRPTSWNGRRAEGRKRNARGPRRGTRSLLRAS